MSEPVIPKHIAIIPDGNRRWAKDKKLPALEGHRRGANNTEKLFDAARDLGIKCISIWAFSTENWKRSEGEVSYLFDLLRELIAKYKKKFLKEKVRFVHLGRKDRLAEDVARSVMELEEETKPHTDFTVAIGLDYGGHDELLRTIKTVNSKGLAVTSQNIETNLDTATLPTIDLIVRTGKERRLSGFMSWQCAYAELYFSDKFFPDFGPKELEAAVTDFSTRDRRFGGDSVNI
jgi:undecaprenyl diphosphate synthase